MLDLHHELQERFGLDDFRPAQREVIEDVLAGKDVLCVMPTGAGKSLCYQLPAVVQGGLTIVVSPLISLMEDQVSQLRDEGITAACINSAMSPQATREVIAQITNGYEGLLYVAPERLFANSFQSILSRLQVKLLAIDEAHCVSQWGHDFRPEYSRLGEIRHTLNNPPTIALTATATRDVREDIIRSMELHEPTIVVTGFDRTNLMYESRRINKIAEKDGELLHLLAQEPGSAIIYCATRKAVDAVSAMLAPRLQDRVVVGYHAGMEAGDRTGNQEKFMDSAGAVAVATNAFGMGINKPDVRLVVHYNVPGTLEAYYQEAGRAGRDGRLSRCTLLYSFQDRKTQEFFIEKLAEKAEFSDPAVVAERQARAREKLDLMIRFAQTHVCRRQQILDYFGDESDVIDCQCDVCRGESGGMVHDPSVPMDPAVVLLTQKLLSAVARLRGQFGVGAVAEVLTGVESDRTQRWRLHELTVFGLLKSTPTKRVIAMLHRMLEAGLARQKKIDGSHGSTIEISAAGIAVMKSEQPPPSVLADLVPRRGSRADGTNAKALGTNPRAMGTNLRAPRQADELESQLDEIAQSRLSRLRTLRNELARSRQLPAYCICHDTTLAEIARENPGDLESLERIKGMGPYKVKTYGEAFLQATSGD